MAERSWFLDIVQECVNYEMKVQRLQEALNKAVARIQELEKKPHLESVKDE